MAQPQEKVMIKRSSKYQDKIAREEAELEELIKAEMKPKEDLQEDEGTQDETTSEEEEGHEEEEGTETLTPEEETFKKRYGDLRRHASEKEKELKKTIESLESRLTETSVPLPASDEELEEWSAKHPDVAAIIETIAAKRADEKFKEASVDMTEVKDNLSKVSRLRAEETIRESHKDFDKLKVSDDFHDWADEQPKWVQDALFDNPDDARSVIRVIDLYKADKGLTATDKKKREKAAAGVVDTKDRPDVDANEASKKIRESSVAKMTMKEYEENEEAIEKAMSSGNFIYDVSGGAR